MNELARVSVKPSGDARQPRVRVSVDLRPIALDVSAAVVMLTPDEARELADTLTACAALADDRAARGVSFHA